MSALYVEPLLDTMLDVLKQRTPPLIGAASTANNTSIEEFREFLISWTGVLFNPPTCYVLTGDMSFDADAQSSEDEKWVVLLRAAYTAGDPEEMTRKGLRYAKVLRDAVKQSFPTFTSQAGTNAPKDWVNVFGNNGQVKDIFVPNLGLNGVSKKQDGRHIGWVDVAVLITAEELP